MNKIQINMYLNDGQTMLREALHQWLKDNEAAHKIGELHGQSYNTDQYRRMRALYETLKPGVLQPNDIIDIT